MADTIHYSLSTFRDTILNAISRLEFELRDASLKSGSSSQPRLEEIIRDLSKRIETLESKREDGLANELLNMKATNNTKNVIVSPNIRSTPALTAAVAAASIALPEFDLNHDDSDSDSCCSSDGDVIETVSAIEKVESFEKEHVVEDGEVVEEEEEQEEVEVEEEEVEEEQEETAEEEEETAEEEEHHEVVEEEVEEEQEELKEIKIKGVKYFIDSNNTLYSETEDGYEEVGTYNPKTKTIEAIVVEEEEEQEDEEAIEVEDFVYKGTTYQKDQEGNVYLDGEQIGTWNGKKIIKNA